MGSFLYLKNNITISLGMILFLLCFLLSPRSNAPKSRIEGSIMALMWRWHSICSKQLFESSLLKAKLYFPKGDQSVFQKIHFQVLFFHCCLQEQITHCLRQVESYRRATCWAIRIRLHGRAWLQQRCQGHSLLAKPGPCQVREEPESLE